MGAKKRKDGGKGGSEKAGGSGKKGKKVQKSSPSQSSQNEQEVEKIIESFSDDADEQEVSSRNGGGEPGKPKLKVRGSIPVKKNRVSPTLLVSMVILLLAVAGGVYVANFTDIEPMVVVTEVIETVHLKALEIIDSYSGEEALQVDDSPEPDVDEEEPLEDGIESLQDPPVKREAPKQDATQSEPVKEEPVKEEPVKKEPVKEEPVKEEPVKAEPVKAEPVKEEPPKEEPVKEEPVKEEPVKEEPSTEEPVKEEPVKAEPVKAEPVKAEPVKEEPVKEESVKEEPVKEEPVKEEPPKEEPVKEEPVKEEPPKEEPVKEEPVRAEPVKEEPVKSEPPTTEPPTTEAPATEAPATEAPATEAPATEPPTTEAPATEAPATEAPATEAPATEAPATEPPTTEAPATEAPATEAPATEAPATEAPATEAPATEAPATEPLIEEPVKTEPPKQEEPKQEPAQTEPPKEEPPKEEPQAETPPTEAPVEEPVKAEPPKQEEPKQEPPKQEELKQEPPKEEAQKQEPVKTETLEEEPPKEEPPKEEPPKEEPQKADPVKTETSQDEEPTPNEKSFEAEVEVLVEQESTKEEEAPKTEEQKEDPRKTYAKADLTNDADFAIRMDLDEADSWLSAGKAVDAQGLYDKLLRTHPSSPRALYGRAMALNDRAANERSNALLEQAIDGFLKVLELADAPKALVMKAGITAGDRQSFRGWTRRAAKTIRRLIELFPDELDLWNDLGVKYLLMGSPEDARLAFQQVLKQKPDDGRALVHIGFILKTTDNDHLAAIPYMQRGIDTRHPATIDGRFYFHLGDAYARSSNNSAADAVYEAGTKLGLFLSKHQRSLYNVDALTGRPWWTPEQTTHADELKILAENWQIIRDEGLAQMDPKSGSFKPEDENLREKGDWKQFMLFQRGQKNEENCRKAPKTCQLIEKHFPDAWGCKRGQVKYSVMHPGVHVWPHTGPTNCRIRAHLGLVVPEGPRIRVVDDIRTWKEGEFIIFDDSFEHEVWHDGNSLRLVLIVDMWHPELSERQKRALTPI